MKRFIMLMFIVVFSLCQFQNVFANPVLIPSNHDSCLKPLELEQMLEMVRSRPWREPKPIPIPVRPDIKPLPCKPGNRFSDLD